MTTIRFDEKAAAAASAADKPTSVPQAAGSKASLSIEQLLVSTKVSELPLAKGKIITVDSKLSPGEGFQLLMDNNILGAPVYDSTHNKYIGFLDVRDLVDLVVHRYDQAHAASPSIATAVATTAPTTTLQVQSPSALPSGAHLHTAKPTTAGGGTSTGPVSAAAASATSASAKAKGDSKVSAVIEELLRTGEVMVGSKMTVSYLCRRHPFRSVPSDATLLDVAKTLCGESHRVPVVDVATQQLTNIISQSSLIEFLRKHLPETAHAEAGKTVDEWKLGTAPVLTVRDNARAIDAFRIMSEKHMSGLAVVNEAGVLVANTASTDLKLYLAHPKVGAQLLSEPILDFLSQLRADDLKTDTRTKVPALSVASTTTLAAVIGRLAATKQHKCFVANAAKHYKPEAVISLTDLLRAVLKLPKPAPVPAEHPPGHARAPSFDGSSSGTGGPAHGKLSDKK